MKIGRKVRIFAEIRTKMRKSLTNFCEYFEFGAVRRCANLVVSFRHQSEYFDGRKETPFRAANNDGRERSWGTRAQFHELANRLRA